MTLNLTQAETIASFADYIAELSLNDLAPATFAQYKQQLRSFQTWLEGRPISANAAKLFVAEMRERGYSQKSIRLYYLPIRGLLEYLGIPLKIKFRPHGHLPPYHSANDLQSLLDTIAARTDKWSHNKERDTLIVLALAFTRLRRAELINLRPCDIAADYLHVSLGKGKRIIQLVQTKGNQASQVTLDAKEYRALVAFASGKKGPRCKNGKGR